MTIQIFVAQDQAMNPLTEKFLNAVFDLALVTVVDETAPWSNARPYFARFGSML